MLGSQSNMTRTLGRRIAATVSMAVLLTASPVGAQQEPAGVLQDDARDRLAILLFANVSGAPEDDWIGVGITEALSVELQNRSVFDVIPVNRVSEAMRAADVSGSEPDPTRLAALWRRLNVRWVLSGGYQRIGDQLRITGQLVDVTTRTITRAVKIDGAVDQLFGLQDRLAAQLYDNSGDAPTVAVVPRTFVDDRGPATVETSSADSGGDSTRATVSGFAVTPTADIDGPPPPVAPETLARDAAGRATVRAAQIAEPLALDGVLDEAAYQTVPALTGFIQQTPDEGDPATERTEAWVFYDDAAVYVSARLWDTTPESQWIANEMQRDSFQIIQNDNFSMAFDTFYDRRNGVAFMVNPIGGFFDFQITDEGNPNSDWNPIWASRVGRFDGGWTVETRIPFKSLRFRPGTTQVWGLQIARNIRSRNEVVHLTPVPISGGPGIFRVSAAGTLTGVEVPSGNRTFEIKPYGIGSLATDINADPVISNEGDGGFGFDVKYGVTQNLTADFTYNTDFAQVEVDEQQVNLTRFSLFFPEKREFFLEGRGIFDFARGAVFGGLGPQGGGRPGSGGFSGGGDKPTIFFSRRIGLEAGSGVPILAGGRLNGKVGQFSVGLLNIQTENEPGVEALSTNFTVIRVSRDILRRSRIGGIFTGRSISTEGPGSNQVYGVDGAFSFYDNVYVDGYYAKTQTPGLEGDDESYQAAFTYNGDLYAFQADALSVGDNFNPEVGFLRRDDFRRSFLTAQYSPRPSAIDAVRQFKFGASLDYIENGAGRVETRLSQARFNTEFENSDQFAFDVQQSYEFLDEPFDIADDVTIPIGGYDFNDFYTSYSMGTQRRISGTLSFQKGGFFSGDLTAVGYRTGRIEVTRQLSVEPGFSVNRIELPEGDFTATLGTARVTYTFTPRIFFSGLLQYNSSNESLGTNLRLRWEYQPGSELFVVYNDQRDTSIQPTPLLENRAFVVKFTRLFRF